MPVWDHLIRGPLNVMKISSSGILALTEPCPLREGGTPGAREKMNSLTERRSWHTFPCGVSRSASCCLQGILLTVGEWGVMSQEHGLASTAWCPRQLICSSRLKWSLPLLLPPSLLPASLSDNCKAMKFLSEVGHGSQGWVFRGWHVAIITKDGPDDSIIHVVFCAKKVNASGWKSKSFQRCEHSFHMT